MIWLIAYVAVAVAFAVLLRVNEWLMSYDEAPLYTHLELIGAAAIWPLFWLPFCQLWYYTAMHYLTERRQAPEAEVTVGEKGIDK